MFVEEIDRMWHVKNVKPAYLELGYMRMSILQGDGVRRRVHSSVEIQRVMSVDIVLFR